jgi:hypothetical protein
MPTRKRIPTSASWCIAQANLRLSAAKKVRIYTGANMEIEVRGKRGAGYCKSTANAVPVVPAPEEAQQPARRQSR